MCLPTPSVYQLLVFFSSILVTAAAALECSQCRAIERNKYMITLEAGACYKGRIPPTPCPNPVNHTHCITYHFRTMETGKMVIFWRKCGTKNEAQQTCKVHDISKVYAQHADLKDPPNDKLRNISLTRTTFTVPIRKATTPIDGATDAITEMSDVEMETTTETTTKAPIQLVEVCVVACDTNECIPSGAARLGFGIGFLIPIFMLLLLV